MGRVQDFFFLIYACISPIKLCTQAVGKVGDQAGRTEMQKCKSRSCIEAPSSHSLGVGGGVGVGVDRGMDMGMGMDMRGGSPGSGKKGDR